MEEEKVKRKKKKPKYQIIEEEANRDLLQLDLTSRRQRGGMGVDSLGLTEHDPFHHLPQDTYNWLVRQPPLRPPVPAPFAHHALSGTPRLSYSSSNVICDTCLQQPCDCKPTPKNSSSSSTSSSSSSSLSSSEERLESFFGDHGNTSRQDTVLSRQYQQAGYPIHAPMSSTYFASSSSSQSTSRIASRRSWPRPRVPEDSDGREALYEIFKGYVDKTTGPGKHPDLEGNLHNKDATWFIKVLEEYHMNSLSESERNQLLSSGLRTKKKHQHSICFEDDQRFVLLPHPALHVSQGDIDRYGNGKAIVRAACKQIVITYRASITSSSSNKGGCIWSALLERVCWCLKQAGHDASIRSGNSRNNEMTLFLGTYHISRSNLRKMILEEFNLRGGANPTTEEREDE